jgi:hypothetical protein
MRDQELIRHYDEFRKHIRAYRHSLELPAVPENEMRASFCIVTEFWSKPKQEALLSRLSAVLPPLNGGSG